MKHLMRNVLLLLLVSIMLLSFAACNEQSDGGSKAEGSLKIETVKVITPAYLDEPYDIMQILLPQDGVKYSATARYTDVTLDPETNEYSFQEHDLQTAVQIKPLSAGISYLCEILKARHIGRLSRGECALAQGTVFTELLNSFERIASHCVAVSGAVRREFQSHPDYHVHTPKAYELNEEQYAKIYDEFLAKYDVLDSKDRPISVEEE